MSDKEFFEDARKAVEQIVEHPKKTPWMWIGALLLVFVFVISAVPIWSIHVNPPPDWDAVAQFELTDAEKTKLERVEYTPTSSIQEAIDQINVHDYRDIVVRLVTSACPTHSDLCYAKAIYYYVRDMQYVSDPQTRQYVQSPAETLLSRGFDCEDASLLTSAMLESVGIDSDVGVTSNHAFVRVQVSSKLFSEGYTWLDPASNNEFGDTEIRNKDVLRWYELA